MKTQNFSENLEKSLERIGQNIKESSIEIKDDKTRKDIIKHSLQSLAVEQESVVSSSQQTIPQTLTSAPTLPKYLQGTNTSSEINRKVENLINIVFSKGLDSALKKAKKSNPFVEDAFHDALTEKLLPELKKRGIIK